MDLGAYERVSVPEVELGAKAETRDWLAQFERVYVGAESITVADTRQKLLSWRTYPVTNGELARAYLRRLFAKGHRTPLMATAANVGFNAQAPLYCEPVRHRLLSYIDIESAYWQLISPYRPDDMPLAASRSVNTGTLDWWRPDEVRETRGLRHAIAGTMWANRLEWCSRGTWTATLTAKRWSNPWMKRHVMHTLHALVSDLMATVTVHAWLTDAAIVDAGDATVVLDHLRDRWHLSARVVETGMGAVWNMTSYSVGEKRSLGVVNGRIPDASAFSNLAVPAEGISWLREERLRVAGSPPPPTPSTGP